jgi:hypothetical protein
MSFGISLITKSFQFEQAMKEADQPLPSQECWRDRVHVSGFSIRISVETHAAGQDLQLEN